ncbi:MAG: thioredoxin family protein [Planctomycetes bacterium]|nr:thioredoxin family protein [Planctomycetota bacterium]
MASCCSANLRRQAFSLIVLGLTISPAAGGDGTATEPKRTISGIVVDGDGKPVAGAEVELLIARAPARAVSEGDGSFQIKTSESLKFEFGLLGRSQDREQLAYLRVAEPDHKIQALRLVLKPARRLEVYVSDGKAMPVAGARAGVFSSLNIVAYSLTDAKGRATLRVPVDSVIEEVYAYRSGAGFDYRSFRKPRDGSPAPEFPQSPISLQLAGARTLRVTALDAENRSIAKLRLYPWYLNKPGEPSDINLSGATDEFGAVTDERGISVWDWLPTWQDTTLLVWPRTDDYARRRLTWDPKAGADSATMSLDHLQWLRGKVTHANDTPAAGYTVRAFGEGYQMDGHRCETQTDKNGKYKLRVAPNLIYLVEVLADKGWAADMHFGFAVLPRIEMPDKDFVLRPATRVHGRLTLGKDQKPLAGKGMWLRRELPPLEVPIADPKNGEYLRLPYAHYHAKSDTKGEFEFFVGPGLYYLGGSDQIKGVKAKVMDQAQLEFNFNAEREETGSLKGKVLAGNPASPVANAVVTGVYKFQGGEFAAKTNAEGKFEAERRRHPLVLHAHSADGKLAGVAEIGPDDVAVAISLSKAARAHGQVLENGEPLAGNEFWYGVPMTLTKDPENPGFLTGFAKRGQIDRAGMFELTGIVPGQEYVVDLRREKEGGNHRLASFRASAGEVVDLKVIRIPREQAPETINDRRQGAFKAKATPVERFETALREARLASQHVLLVFALTKDLLTEQLFAAAEDRKSQGDCWDDYRVLWITTDADHFRAAQALAEKLNVKLRDNGEPILVVTDQHGKCRAVVDTSKILQDGKLAPDAIRQFLEPAAPERLDADELLADALAQAKKENKRVLVQETATWCGPCRRLSRFLDGQRTLWEKDYVWLKLDRRWKNAEEIAERLRGRAKGGIPWTAILDADGKVLATSNRKDGQNFGFPTEPDSIAHFADMLRTTAIRLTPSEIGRLVEALKSAGMP